MPGPPPTNKEEIASVKPMTNIQKLRLLSRGNATSGAPIISGTKKFPKPPNMAGMITKNIMRTPCSVTNEL